MVINKNKFIFRPFGLKGDSYIYLEFRIYEKTKELGINFERWKKLWSKSYNYMESQLRFCFWFGQFKIALSREIKIENGKEKKKGDC